jgi:hypothetical protein
MPDGSGSGVALDVAAECKRAGRSDPLVAIRVEWPSAADRTIDALDVEPALSEVAARLVVDGLVAADSAHAAFSRPRMGSNSPPVPDR